MPDKSLVIGLVNSSVAGVVELQKLASRNPGYAVELTKMICKSLDYNCIFEVAPTVDYGKLSPEGNWIGLLGQMRDGMYNTSVPIFTPTYSRLLNFDFAPAGIYEPMAFVTRLRTIKPEGRLLSVFSPFPSQLWSLIFTSIMVLTVLITIQQNFPSTKRKIFSGSNLIFAVGTAVILLVNLFRHGQRLKKAKRSTVLLFSLWGFASILLIASYSSSLLSNLISFPMEMPFGDFEGLTYCIRRRQCSLIMTPAGNSFLSEISAPSSNSSNLLLKIALQENPPVRVDSVDQMIRMVLGNEDTFFVTWPSAIFTYNQAVGDCLLGSLGFSYEIRTFPFRQNDPMAKYFGSKLKRLGEAGVIARLQKKYSRDRKCDNHLISTNRLASSALKIRSFLSTFFLFSCGVAVSSAVLLLEMRRAVRKRNRSLDKRVVDNVNPILQSGN